MAVSTICDARPSLAAMKWLDTSEVGFCCQAMVPA
jgi:hypothetical protein